MQAITVIINFPGGIISPGNLYNILVAASKAKIQYVRFGLRQQLFLDTISYNAETFTNELDRLAIDYEIDHSQYPNMVSSYPAEEIFVRNSWLTEGVYQDVLDTIDFKPRLKVNICDNNQSFTPMLTGNINWIASLEAEHYWHLIIRFPKTNVVYEWDQLCYTNSISKVTRQIEALITSNSDVFIDNVNASGAELFKLIQTDECITKAATNRAPSTPFNLPYYEGLNRYNNKYWLGIYRRDELFKVAFLKKICLLCTETKVGQICCTSWKSIIIKGIAEKDKARWNSLLEEFNINMRHAANELNFQIEDNSTESLDLKNYLVKYLSIDDIRTYGICFGIKTRKKSEIFSSILIRKRYLIRLPGIKLLPVYDILRAKDFNPNERTEEIFSSGNPRAMLPEQLRRVIMKFYVFRKEITQDRKVNSAPAKEKSNPVAQENLYQCSKCFTIYSEALGEIESGILPHTPFEDLPLNYCCTVCESGKDEFIKIATSTNDYVMP
ncbi:rubredoxin [Pedobacter petrophilus]|uniref:Rubredoxin n=1 Tax=Pedobacter petrophilus TaxID=1908241 RepID=A0A7K0G4D6_9SPHI|nr:rubredoxin [Pedobacter petrophilus]MRX78677.1 rubredoxin [Pedobacter petrophilus]